MPKISVVIPVYKVGKYIENSMKSVCCQTFKDFEVVLVDNNSPDDSIDIAERVLKEGEIDYRVVKQTIQGLPAARNMGIREAKGEWIVSIDPDDTVSSRFLADLYECATSNGLDVVFSKYAEVGANELFVFSEECKDNVTEFYNRDDVLSQLLVRKLPLMISNMFFKKEAFIEKNCWFDEDVVLGADLINLWRILINSDKIAYLNKFLYNHFDRPDSLMTAPNWKKIDSNLMGYNRLRSYIGKNYSEQMGQWVYGRAVFAFLATLCVYGGKQMYLDYINKYYNKEIHIILNTFPDKKIQILDKLLYFSPIMFYSVNKTLRNPNSTIWKLLSRKIH
jgi:glycosyltransferase involved in cell wall biosynthesis